MFESHDDLVKRHLMDLIKASLCRGSETSAPKTLFAQSFPPGCCSSVRENFSSEEEDADPPDEEFPPPRTILPDMESAVSSVCLQSVDVEAESLD